MAKVQAHRIITDPDPFARFNLAAGYRVGDLVYLSGLPGVTPDGAEPVSVDDFDAQAEQAFKNIEWVLSSAGSSLDQIIKVTIYLTDMGYYDKILELRERWFTPPYPADTIVEVSALAMPELMIEIDVIAMVDGEIVG
ncbi:RidA family protein [Candidatus Poriferisodalis sp.]|uniref:RidA family protein n=1 Tax=Candidatus Poriferisodalis sp. TaxID=3101277 RepID=UPI003AF82E65